MRVSSETGDNLSLRNKLLLVAWLCIGGVVAAGLALAAYGVFMYFGSAWVAFFMSAAGFPNDTRDRIVAAMLSPEAWLYYAPGAAVLLYFLGIAAFCCSRSLLGRRRKHAQETH